MIRRVAWHFRQVSSRLDGGFFRPLLIGLAVFLVITSAAVWLFETDRANAQGQSVCWTSTTVPVQGDGSFAAALSPAAWLRLDLRRFGESLFERHW